MRGTRPTRGCPGRVSAGATVSYADDPVACTPPPHADAPVTVPDSDRGVDVHHRCPGRAAYAALSCSRSTCWFHSRFTERHASSF